MNLRIQTLEDDISEAKDKDKEGNLAEEKNLREKIAKDYGIAMAIIQRSKEDIVKERQQLEEKIHEVKTGGGDKAGDESLTKIVKDITSGKGVRAQQDRLKKLRQQLEEDRADDGDTVMEAESTIDDLASKYKIPKDELSIFEDYFTGKTEKVRRRAYVRGDDFVERCG